MNQYNHLDLDIASLLIHADGGSDELAVGVPISVSTTFRHARPIEKARPATNGTSSSTGLLHPSEPEGFDSYTEGGPKTSWDPADPKRHIYSRYTQPTLTRAEKVLGALTHGHALAFGSGLSAIYAVLLHFQPEVIAISAGYHGSHETIAVYRRTRPGVQIIDLDDDYTQYKDKKLLCWCETPVNPDGLCRDLAKYVKKTREVTNGKIAVDATFGPPPLQNPFEFGVDLVMHSGTKYFSGHSDALIGVLVTEDSSEWQKLWEIRTFTGMVPGSLETWLILRSLRTVTLRVKRQSETATALAQWLYEVALHTTSSKQTYDGCVSGVLASVSHAALQGKSKGAFDPLGGEKPLMTGGPACFAIMMQNSEQAQWLPHEMKIMVPATSLGGVESLIEYRLQSDAAADPRLIRLSIGLEDLEDLKEDFRRAFKAVQHRGVET